MRKGNYARACETLEELVGRSRQAGHAMRLTIGEEPVEDKRISKGPYDFLSVDSGEEIAPGESILLKSVQELLQVQQRTRTVYLGDYRRTLEVADIAQVLGSGGKLELVEAEAQAA
ncbi:MAG: hypothetical protein M3N59_00630 [bacterium]|nr:hypothetical protein [bacterium]